MSVIGTSTEWSDLIDSILPDILSLVVTSWEEMPSPAEGETEDNITIALCRTLMKNRTARGLMFQIRTQVVELEPAPGEELGRLDIAFIPLIPREDVYFCLESKRLNVIKGGKFRAYASEYVRFGMMRFVTGQYSKMVRHGGMLGYVLDGNIPQAISNIQANIQQRQQELRMNPPGSFEVSTLMGFSWARETHHQRDHETIAFRIHHLFMSATKSSNG